MGHNHGIGLVVLGGDGVTEDIIDQLKQQLGVDSEKRARNTRIDEIEETFKEMALMDILNTSSLLEDIGEVDFAEVRTAGCSALTWALAEYIIQTTEVFADYSAEPITEAMIRDKVKEAKANALRQFERLLDLGADNLIKAKAEVEKKEANEAND